MSAPSRLSAPLFGIAGRAALLLTLATATASASVCYGTVAAGRLDGGVQLPAQGTNYVSYSTLGVSLGRTYVHQAVRDIVVDAYAAVATSAPESDAMDQTRRTLSRGLFAAVPAIV